MARRFARCLARGFLLLLLTACAACSTSSSVSVLSPNVSDASCSSLHSSCTASGVATECVSIAAASNQTLCSLALAAVQGANEPPASPPATAYCPSLQECCEQIVLGVDRTTCDLIVTENDSTACVSAQATLQEMGFCPVPVIPDSGA